MAPSSIAPSRWMPYRDIVEDHYIRRNMSLDNVRKILETEHNFSASKQQLFRQIQKWSFKKNARSEEWKQITRVLGNRSRLGKQSEILLHGNRVDPKKLKKAISRYDLPSLLEKLPTGPQTSIGSRTRTEPGSGNGPESCIDILSPAQQVSEIHLTISLPSYQSFHVLKQSYSRFFSNSTSNTSASLENDEESGTLFTRDGRSMFMDINNESDLIDSLPWPGEISPITKSHHERSSTSSVARAWDIVPTRQLLENRDAYFLDKPDDEPSMNLNDMIQSDQMATSLLYVKHMIYLISNNMTDGEDFVEWIIAQGIEQEFSKLLKTKTPTFAAMAPEILYWAIYKGSMELLKAAIEHGFNLNKPIKSSDHRTPLVLAITWRQQHVAEFLVLAGADVNCHAELDFDSDSDSDDEFEHSSIPSHGGTPPPIWHAANSRMFELIPFLVEHDADPNLGAGQSSFRSTLTKAINHGADISIVQTLLDAGADPNGIDLSDKSENCLPLQAAVKRNEFDLFSLLLQRGAKINAPFERGFEEFFNHVNRGDWWPRNLDRLNSALATAIEVKNRRTDTFLRERDYDNRMLNALLEAGADMEPEMPISFVLVYHTNWTPLQVAASHGDIEMVKYLLSSGVSVQNNPEHGMSALACAAGKGSVDVMRLLIENGADVNSPAVVRGSRTALQAAVSNGSLAVIDIMLDVGADPNAVAVPADGFTMGERAAMLALSHETPAALSRLIQAGATISKGWETWNLLRMAANNNNRKMIHYLQELGIDVNQVSAKHIRPPLDLAIKKRDQQLVKLLIERGAKMHWSLMRLAVEMEDTEMVQLLHNKGAPLESGNGFFVALEDAIVSVRPEMTTKLLCLGVDANKHLTLHTTDTFGGKTFLNTMAPLQLAIHDIEGERNVSATTSVCSALIAAGARVNEIEGLGNKCSCAGEEPSYDGPTCDVCEETCLCAALIRKLDDLVRLLLQSGADVHLRSPCGTTPLQAAAGQGNLQMLQELLDRGVNVNAPAAGAQGRTPLQAAAEKGSLACVRVLIERGANVNAPPSTNRGVTALQASAINGFLVITKMLLEAGADIGAAAAEIEGRTAIDGAAEMGRLDTLQLLLDNYHGDVTLAVLCDNATVFARRQRHAAVVKFLQEYKSGHGFSGQNAGEQFEI